MIIATERPVLIHPTRVTYLRFDNQYSESRERHKATAETSKDIQISSLEAATAVTIILKNIVNPPRIVIGSPYENPITLNRNDAGGDRGIWDQEEVYGKWQVKIIEGDYNIRFKFIEPIKGGGKMVLETGAGVHQLRQHDKISDMIELKGVALPAINTDLIPFYLIDGRRIFPFWVELELIN